jgi:hypothetical protein
MNGVAQKPIQADLLLNAIRLALAGEAANETDETRVEAA